MLICISYSKQDVACIVSCLACVQG